MKQDWEKGGLRKTCHICKQIGHNRRACPKAIEIHMAQFDWFGPYSVLDVHLDLCLILDHNQASNQIHLSIEHHPLSMCFLLQFSTLFSNAHLLFEKCHEWLSAWIFNLIIASKILFIDKNSPTRIIQLCWELNSRQIFEVEATFCVFQCKSTAVFTCVLMHTFLVWFNWNDS